MNQANNFLRQQKMLNWCKDLMQRTDWLIIDTETTGVDSSAEVVQIAVIDHEGKEVFHSLIKPLSPIPQSATDIHGITNEAVSCAPLFSTVYDELKELIGSKLLIAYNADFDKRILAQSCRLHGLPVFSNSWECAMEQYAQYHGDYNDFYHSYRWQKLAVAVKSVGIEDNFEFHGALADCMATWALIERLGR